MCLSSKGVGLESLWSTTSRLTPATLAAAMALPQEQMFCGFGKIWLPRPPTPRKQPVLSITCVGSEVHHYFETSQRLLSCALPSHLEQLTIHETVIGVLSVYRAAVVS